ncbi:MAG: 30S ribosomal protein S4 [Proteobacteria bacterium]|nr:30S ribosomal protein S4 [Pseudomonadota bacterium]
MTKRHNCKFALSRRIGQSLWGSAKDPVHKRNYPSGQHGPVMGRKKRVGYGEQLESTQVLRGYYGNITKKQFTRIVKEAMRRRGDSTENLIGLLESRLDAVVYRAKFASTPFAARQLINHKHIMVNGKVVNIASYRLRPGDVVEIRTKSREMVVIAESLASGERNVPEYISAEPEKMRAEYIRIPVLADVPYPVEMKPSMIIGFFSR